MYHELQVDGCNAFCRIFMPFFFYFNFLLSVYPHINMQRHVCLRLELRQHRQAACTLSPMKCHCCQSILSSSIIYFCRLPFSMMMCHKLWCTIGRRGCRWNNQNGKKTLNFSDFTASLWAHYSSRHMICPDIIYTQPSNLPKHTNKWLLCLERVKVMNE